MTTLTAKLTRITEDTLGDGFVVYEFDVNVGGIVLVHPMLSAVHGKSIAFLNGANPFMDKAGDRFAYAFADALDSGKLDTFTVEI